MNDDLRERDLIVEISTNKLPWLNIKNANKEWQYKGGKVVVETNVNELPEFDFKSWDSWEKLQP